MRLILLLVFFSAVIYSNSAAGLPKSWKACNVSQKDREKCLKDAAQTAVTLLINGEKTLGVPPIDPMFVDRTNMKDSGNGKGPFNFRLTLTNYTTTGYKSSQIDSFKLDCDKSTIALNLTVMNDVTMKGRHYKGSGKILLIAVDASGDFTFILKGYKIGMNLLLSQVNKKDGKYFKIDSSAVSFSIPIAHLHFGNLFNGNKVLEDNLNAVFNENWPAFFVELKPSLDSDLGAFLVRNFVKPIVEQIAVSVLCPA